VWKRSEMTRFEEHPLHRAEAALWFLGQAGAVVRASGVTVAIDPYLSDSAAAGAPEFKRLFPPPVAPEELRVDLYLVTHDHLDHLDPETVRRYAHRDTTQFVAPRFAARKLLELALPPEKIHRLDAGEEWAWRGVSIAGTFALPTSTDVLDTTGFLLKFPNGRTVYHTADTAFTPLLLQAAPRGVEMMLLPINGKWGNLNVEQAVELTAAVGPRYVLPIHYDMMALNAENPETFRWFCQQRKLTAQCVIPTVMQPFVWE
jgi:L-ascorbate 6-phosphate lactonase